MGAGQFSVVDIETTGLRACDRIVEIAVLQVGPGGVVVSAFESLLNPGADPGATRLHGITTPVCAAAPTFRQVARDLHARLAGTVLVAHNLRFDWFFLREEFRRCGVTFMREPAGLCTARACRRLGLPARLDAACAALGIPQGPGHRARADAEATALLWATLRARGAFACDGQPLQAGSGWRRLTPSRVPLPRRGSCSAGGIGDKGGGR